MLSLPEQSVGQSPIKIKKGVVAKRKCWSSDTNESTNLSNEISYGK